MSKKKKLPAREISPRKTLDTIMEKDRDRKALMSGSDYKEEDIQFRFQTGLFAFDSVLGGGLPAYKMIGVYGPENGGKTTEALLAIRGIQQTCFRCFQLLAACSCKDGPDLKQGVWIGIDDDFDAAWAQALGVDLDRVHVGIPDDGQDALELGYRSLEAYDCGIVVIDSIAALFHSEELQEHSAHSERPRMTASLFSRSSGNYRYTLFRRFKARLPAVVVFTNQIRQNVGVTMGPTEHMPGGHALRHILQNTVRTSKVSLGDKADQYDLYGIPSVSRHMLSSKKDRGGVFASAFDFLMGKADHEEQGVKRGVPLDQNVVIRIARDSGIISGDGPYKIGDLTYRTLKDLRSDIDANPGFYLQLQRMIHEKRGARYCPTWAQQENTQCVTAQSADVGSTPKEKKEKSSSARRKT